MATVKHGLRFIYALSSESISRSVSIAPPATISPRSSFSHIFHARKRAIETCECIISSKISSRIWRNVRKFIPMWPREKQPPRVARCNRRYLRTVIVLSRSYRKGNFLCRYSRCFVKKKKRLERRKRHVSFWKWAFVDFSFRSSHWEICPGEKYGLLRTLTRASLKLNESRYKF